MTGREHRRQSATGSTACARQCSADAVCRKCGMGPCEWITSGEYAKASADLVSFRAGYLPLKPESRRELDSRARHLVRAPTE